jgi:hypothetical protein
LPVLMWAVPKYWRSNAPSPASVFDRYGAFESAPKLAL